MDCLRSLHVAIVLVPFAAVAQTPPAPTPAPAPTPRFNSGSPLDGIRNQAWAELEEMTDAYEQCDAERFERALNELEQLRQEAKAAAAAATGSAEFSTIKPEEANGLADALADQIRPRQGLLLKLKRECARHHRPGGLGTILGPRRSTGTTGTQSPAQDPKGGTGQQQQPPPNPQPPTAQPPPTEPVESILDEIEEAEQVEAEQKAKQGKGSGQPSGRASDGSAQSQSPPPAQGLSEAEQKDVAGRLEEAERIEETVRDLEADEWLSEEVRADILKRFRDSLLQDKRFPPDSIQRWVERLNRVWESLPPDAKAAADRPQGPVRSTILPPKLPPMPPPSHQQEAQQGQPRQTEQQAPRGTPLPLGLPNPLNIFGGGEQKSAPDGRSSPVVDGLNILGGANSQPASNRNAPNADECGTQENCRAAPVDTERPKAKTRPRRDRQRDRCEGKQGQDSIDCPNP